MDITRVSRIQVLWHTDEDYDISHLGEFRHPDPGEYYIERTTGRLKSPKGRTLAQHEGGGFIVDPTDYEYFVPSRNHVPHRRANWSGVSLDKIAPYTSFRKADYAYALMDWSRAEDFLHGLWCMSGIEALAVIETGRVTVRGNEKVFRGTSPQERIRSAGLWGIESDSDPAYIRTIVLDELSDLQAALKRLGLKDYEDLFPKEGEKIPIKQRFLGQTPVTEV